MNLVTNIRQEGKTWIAEALTPTGSRLVVFGGTRDEAWSRAREAEAE